MLGDLERYVCTCSSACIGCERLGGVSHTFKHSDYSFSSYYNEKAWVTAAPGTEENAVGFCLLIRCPSTPGHWSMTAPNKHNSMVLVHESKWPSAAIWDQNALRNIKLDSTLLGTSSLFQSLSFSTGNGFLSSDEHSDRPVLLLGSPTFSSLYRLSCSSRRCTSASSALRSSA